MASSNVLGLDIGGANLKAATPDKRAVSFPFALWKQPDRLPAALAELVGRFPDSDELAVTMTGELCDCYETKRQGVHAILDAAEFAAAGRPVRVWGTGGEFVDVPTARRDTLTVAAANWHALATFAGRFAPHHGGMLIDIGSTTTDLIPLNHGIPSTYGQTDWGRLQMRELVYAGVRRTPVFAVYTDRVCAELFATMADVYVVLGLMPEDPTDAGTANGRPLTVEHSFTRLARVVGADREELDDDHLVHFATQVHGRLLDRLAEAARAAYYDAQRPPELRAVVVSGAGEFLARQVAERAFSGAPVERTVSLNDDLGPAVSACAPAYAVAVLAAERRP
ncbi:MAG: hypothetical protein K2X87_05155 [Gemmataceae bacterium]|nr:hypothetical protein [Gemmataceae bacterium]